MGKQSKRKIQNSISENKKQRIEKLDKELQEGVFVINKKEKKIKNFLNQPEEAYELKYRNSSIKNDVDDDKEKIEHLPIKLLDGSIQRVIAVKEKIKKVDDDINEEDHDENEENEQEKGDEDVNNVKYDDNKNIKSIDEQFKHLSPKLRLITAKEELAGIAQKISEDPEENYGKIKSLFDYLESKDFKIVMYAIITIALIFKDIIPGYYIRPLTDVEKSAKVTKEVKKIRSFEQFLINNYQNYLDRLYQFEKNGKTSNINTPERLISDSSVSAACLLLNSVAYFNFREKVLKIIIDRISYFDMNTNINFNKENDNKDSFQKCINSLIFLFENDNEGNKSFDAIRMISKMIKIKKYKVHESILLTFLHLRLLKEFNSRASLTSVDKTDEDEESTKKLKKKDRVHFTKKQRKALKAQKEVEEDYRKAECIISDEQRHKFQGDSLKLIFTLYFNILKEFNSPLIGVALEGLAQFSHLINADFFGDILVVLRELITDKMNENDNNNNNNINNNDNNTKEILLCITTAFSILSSQPGEGANLDLTFFVDTFYSLLLTLSIDPNIEVRHKNYYEDDSKNLSLKTNLKVNVPTEIELIVKAFEVIFFQQRGVSKLRICAFAKRLAIVLLNFPEKSVLQSLIIIEKMMKKYSVIESMFSTEDQVLNGTYNMTINNPELSNPLASAFFEFFLLKHHYSKRVSNAVTSMFSTHSE